MPIDATQPYDDSNIFARILRGEIPSKRVYEDDYALAFHDINPAAPTHILVIPKGPYVSWDDFSAKASEAEIAGFVRAVGKVARDAGALEGGYRLLANTGLNSGQEVRHLHGTSLLGGRSGPCSRAESSSAAVQGPWAACRYGIALGLSAVRVAAKNA
jgi:histidine triad (HIT) family protein